MNWKNVVTVVVMATFITGCAGFDAGPINNSADDAKEKGVRYYETAPFLLVYSDGKGNLTSKIIMMPDTSKKMVIDLYGIAAKNNSTLTFENGTLKSSKFILDSTVVPSKILDTIQTLGTAAISAAFNSPSSGAIRTVPAPYLFKIVIDEDGTRLVGNQGIGPDGQPLIIQVNVTSEAAANAQTVTESSKEASK